MNKCHHDNAVHLTSTAPVVEDIIIGKPYTDKTQFVTLSYCPDCHCAWVKLETDGEECQLLPETLVLPETDFEAKLCACNREMKIDYRTMTARCRHPLCGTTHRIPGLTEEAEQRKLRFEEMKQELFDALAVHPELRALKGKTNLIQELHLSFTEEEFQVVKANVRDDERRSRGGYYERRGERLLL